MKKTVFCITVMTFLILLFSGCSKLKKEQKTSPPKPSAIEDASLSPVDKWLARATPVLDDKEGSLNPYVIKIIDAYPLDGSYPYRWEKNEYDIYNGVTQDLVYKGQVVAKAHPNKTRCSNCCGLTFEIFFRAMQMRNIQKGISPDDFNGMSFDDLFNAMLIWFIVGEQDSPQKAIECYGLGKKIADWEDARAGDFCDISRSGNSGHSVIFIGWVYDPAGKIEGMEYFSSNSSGVGFQTEFFSDSDGKVLREWVRLARVGSIQNYQSFDKSTIPDRKTYAPK